MNRLNTSKIIFSPQLANYLLNAGFSIIKLKPKHDAKNETVFVFRVEEGFYDAIDEWREKIGTEAE